MKWFVMIDFIAHKNWIDVDYIFAETRWSNEANVFLDRYKKYPL